MSECRCPQNDKIDPYCLIHGKKMSEHKCLYCCICFKELTIEECAIDKDGKKWDMCKECGKRELI